MKSDQNKKIPIVIQLDHETIVILDTIVSREKDTNRSRFIRDWLRNEAIVRKIPSADAVTAASPIAEPQRAAGTACSGIMNHLNEQGRAILDQMSIHGEENRAVLIGQALTDKFAALPPSARDKIQKLRELRQVTAKANGSA